MNEYRLHRLEKRTALVAVFAIFAGMLVVLTFFGVAVADRPVWSPPDIPGGPPFVPPPVRDAGQVQVIIGFKNLPDADLVRQHGGEVRRQFTIIRAISARLSPEAVEKLRTDPKVAYVEPDSIAFAVGEQIPWGVTKINAPQVWQAPYNNRGTGVKVAVLDTGIQYNHPDLKANIKGGVDYTRWDGSTLYLFWTDKNGHGTHVAGTIAAVDNDIGVVGVAPEAWLYAVKVLNNQGWGYYSDIIQGVEWAKNNGMQIITMSLGGTSDSQALHDAIIAAKRNAGIIVVAAAGNSGDGNPATDNILYPARYDEVISVGATDQNDNVATWSSDGEELDVSAPGVGILSTYKGSIYATGSGTSMATPHTTGTIALMLKAGIQPNDIQTKLQNTAVDIRDSGFDVFSGYGRIDAMGAVS